MFGKILSLLLLSSIKFIFAFPIAYKFHFSFILTFIVTSAGGILGIIFFSYFWEQVIRLYMWFVHSYLYHYPKIRKLLKKFKQFFIKPKNKRQIPFKKKRQYVRLKNNWGILGLALLTPIVLSIPLGTFLTVRFYGRNIKTIVLLSTIVVFLSALMSCLTHFYEICY